MTNTVGTLLASAALILSFALVGCNSPRTLEEYFAEGGDRQALEEARQRAASMTTYGDVSMDVSGNGIKCTVRLDKTFEENPLADGVFEKSDTTELAKSIAELEDGAQLTGCTLEYVFRDANDLVLYQAKVDRNGLV